MADDWQERSGGRRRARGRWVTLLGLAVALALLWWLFREEDPAEVWGHVRSADFGLLLLAVGLTTATFPVRAIRWKYLLAPAQQFAPFRSRLEAVCIGFMANNLLPRAGELARAYAYSRRERIPAATAFATLVVERLLDGIAILLLLLAALVSPLFPASALPDALVTGIQVVCVFLGLVIAGSGFLLGAPGLCVRAAAWFGRTLLPTRWADSFVSLVDNFAEGLASLRGWRLLAPAIAWSLGLWSLQSLSLWIGFLAFDIDLAFDAALLTNASVAIASAIPAPGFFGTFHAAAKLALSDVYAVSEANALGFAVGWHLGAFLPITVIGLWYARKLGLSLRRVGARHAAEGSPARGDR